MESKAASVYYISAYVSATRELNNMKLSNIIQKLIILKEVRCNRPYLHGIGYCVIVLEQSFITKSHLENEMVNDSYT